MRLTDTLFESFTALSSNKVRSALTVLGIVIGISSVVVLLALGAGAQRTVQQSIQSIGSNLLVVSPGRPRSFGGAQMSRGSAQSLTVDDAAAIAAEVADIEAVAPEVSTNAQVTTKGANTNVSVRGTTAEYLSVRNLAMASGSFLTPQHEKGWPKVAVIGPTTAEDLFGLGNDPVGQKIRIQNTEFTIIGVTEAKGGSGFMNQDDFVIVPLTTAMQFLTGGDYLGSISVQAREEDVMGEVQAGITAVLLRRHGLASEDEADFYIQNQADIVEAASTVTETFTALLASIAAISLLVGGIGIMNMMLTNVTERTREIGLRKAVGAKRREITQQFLFESVALTLLGGALGVGCGWLIGAGLGRFIEMAVSIQWSAVALAFAVSAAIGIVFGYYPARRAARLNPIVALRHE